MWVFNLHAWFWKLFLSHVLMQTCTYFRIQSCSLQFHVNFFFCKKIRINLRIQNEMSPSVLHFPKIEFLLYHVAHFHKKRRNGIVCKCFIFNTKRVAFFRFLFVFIIPVAWLTQPNTCITQKYNPKHWNEKETMVKENTMKSILYLNVKKVKVLKRKRKQLSLHQICMHLNYEWN